MFESLYEGINSRPVDQTFFCKQILKSFSSYFWRIWVAPVMVADFLTHETPSFSST